MQIFIWFSENSKFSFFCLVLIPQIKRFQLYHWVVCLRLFSCWRNKRDYCIPDIRVKVDSAFNINLSLSLSLSLCVCLTESCAYTCGGQRSTSGSLSCFLLCFLRQCFDTEPGASHLFRLVGQWECQGLPALTSIHWGFSL